MSALAPIKNEEKGRTHNLNDSMPSTSAVAIAAAPLPTSSPPVTKRRKKEESRNDVARQKRIECLLEKILMANGDFYYLVKYQDLDHSHNDLEKDDGSLEPHLISEFDAKEKKIREAKKKYMDYLLDRECKKSFSEWVTGMNKGWELESIFSVAHIGSSMCYTVKFKESEDFEVIRGEILKDKFYAEILKFHCSREKADEFIFGGGDSEDEEGFKLLDVKEEFEDEGGITLARVKHEFSD